MSGNDPREKLNEQLSHHIRIILKCTLPSPKYGRLLLASSPESRYPYVYPRDSSCAVQLLRRLAGSEAHYEAGPEAFELMKWMPFPIRADGDSGTVWREKTRAFTSRKTTWPWHLHPVQLPALRQEVEERDR